ncbi:MAG TPA: hypothetical protein VNT52_16860 [Acidimicrobiales bacterium]|nr:hypothetical protein [Acidimicrobiales bacterium]
MRRVVAVLVGSAIAVGGGAAAWASTAGGPDGTRREAARACLSQAREATPDADKLALRQAVKACLAEAGMEGRNPSPEQRAKGQAVKACVDAARDAHPDDKAQARAQARSCMEQAGITPGRIRAKGAGARECLSEVRTANPDASKAEIRSLVRACVGKG